LFGSGNKQRQEAEAEARVGMGIAHPIHQLVMDNQNKTDLFRKRSVFLLFYLPIPRQEAENRNQFKEIKSFKLLFIREKWVREIHQLNQMEQTPETHETPETLQILIQGIQGEI
jgi:hypothetical protein